MEIVQCRIGSQKRGDMMLKLQELGQFKETILQLYDSDQCLVEEFPKVLEAKLGIKVSPKTLRNAFKKWNRGRYVPKEHKLRMIGIWKRWEKRGRKVEFKHRGKPYSHGKLKRFIAEQKSRGELDDRVLGELMDYSGETPMEIDYFDPEESELDLLTLDDASQKQSSEGLLAIPFRSKDDFHVQVEVTTFQASDDAHSTFSPAVTKRTLSEIDLEGPNGSRLMSLLRVWQRLVTLSPSLDPCINDRLEPLRNRASTIYQRHFCDDGINPFNMDQILARALDNDHLQDAEEIAYLAVELSELLFGSDNVESWKAKGNLGRVFHEQGRLEAAQQIEEATVHFFLFEENTLHLDGLLYQLNLASTLMQLGERDDAKDLSCGVVKSSSQVLTKNHEVFLDAKLHLAEIYLEFREYSEAKTILEEFIKSREKHRNFGYAKAQLLQAYVMLADAMSCLGYHGNATEIQTYVEDEFRRSLPTRPMWTLELVRSVGDLLANQKQYARAELVYRSLLQAMMDTMHSTRHPKIMFAKGYVSYALFWQDKLEEAKLIDSELLDISKEIYGLNHRITLTFKSNIAWCYKRAITFSQWETRIHEAWKLRAEQLGENDIDTWTSKLDYTYLQCMTKKWDLVEKLLEELGQQLNDLPKGKSKLARLEFTSVSAEYYFESEKYAQAYSEDEKAFHLAEQIYGKDHPRALIYLQSMAQSAYRMDDYENAHAIILKGISRLEGSVGRDHPEVLSFYIDQAAILQSQNQWKEAEAIRKRVLETNRATYEGESHPSVIYDMSRLAKTYRSQRKYSDAELLYNRTLEVAKKVLGPGNLQFVLIQLDYATLMKQQGKMNQARQMYEKILEPISHSIKSSEGPEELTPLVLQHPQIEFAITDFAYLLVDMGDLRGGLQLFQRILSFKTQFFGSTDPRCIKALSNVAWAYFQLGDYCDSLRLYREALTKTQEIYGKDHPETLKERRSLCWILEKMNMFTECLENFIDLLKATKAIHGEKSSQTATILYEIAKFQLNRKKFSEAQNYFQDVLAISQNISSRIDIMWIMMYLGVCGTKLGNPDAAEAQLKDAIKFGQDAFEPEDPVLFKSKLFIIEHYIYSGRFSEAELAAKELIQQSEQYGWQSYGRCTMLQEKYLGKSLVKQRKFQEAEQFLEEAIRRRTIVSAKDKWILYLKAYLAEVKHDCKKYQEEEALLEEVYKAQEKRCIMYKAAFTGIITRLADVKKELGKRVEARVLYKALANLNKTMWGESSSQYAMAVKKAKECLDTSKRRERLQRRW